ncbi:MAG TPA: hypothetical protein VGR07_19555, partial [Thermoanaerobaculia bacterium]|jgi:hypothetical protein|nr:hypothetical protein [Thermoanaerobaculia bacterium]
MNGRWQFPVGVFVAAVALVGATPSGDPLATHNMLVVGERTIYLSHLPMFQEEGQPPMPHRYQAILEATFAKQEDYAKDRQAHPATTIYTLNPKEFVLPDLVAQRQPLQSFKAKAVFRGHLERAGKVAILQDVRVRVTRVIHFRQFDPKAEKPPQLEYLLFGKGGELFLAHRIVGPPDFDQVLSVKAVEPALTDGELAQGVTVVFPGTQNTATGRLGVKKVAGEATLAGSPGVHKKIQVEVGKELYFEEGELRVPATFKSTSEEMKAGFP